MKKTIILLSAIFLMVPGLVFSDIVTFKVGYFIPRAQSDLWQDELDNMDFTKSGFQDSNFGFGYEYFLSRELSFVLNVEGYTRNKTGLYRDYAGIMADDGYLYAFLNEPGDAIVHTFSVSITPIQASVKLTPLGRRHKIIPYIGGGVGLYVWAVRLSGDMVDFSQPVEFTDGTIGYPVYLTDAREENKFKVGFHGFGGLMIPVANRISFEAEFKVNMASGELTDAFEGFEPFDLSGYQISLGLNYWF
ncbi:MAG: hypothetical protein ACE5LV_01165 [Candidatus Aminicenantales bacterium]